MNKNRFFIHRRIMSEEKQPKEEPKEEAPQKKGNSRKRKSKKKPTINGYAKVTAGVIAAVGCFLGGRYVGIRTAESTSLLKQSAEVTAKHLIEKYGYLGIAKAVFVREYNDTFGTNVKADQVSIEKLDEGEPYLNVSFFTTKDGKNYAVYGDSSEKSKERDIMSVQVREGDNSSRYTIAKSNKGKWVPAFRIDDPRLTAIEEVPEFEMKWVDDDIVAAIIQKCYQAGSENSSDDIQGSKRITNEQEDAATIIAEYLEEKAAELGSIQSAQEIDKQQQLNDYDKTFYADLQEELNKIGENYQPGRKVYLGEQSEDFVQ